MTSERKIRANRSNAQKSSGPTTARGRANSSRNALRHSLSLPSSRDQQLGEQLQQITHSIIGMGDTVEIKEIARQIAEAQVELRRARSARYQVLTEIITVLSDAARLDDQLDIVVDMTAILNESV
jgi:chemotaxis protein histidine kinase CheA